MAPQMKISSVTESTIANTSYSNQTIGGDFYDGSSINPDGITGNKTSWIVDYAKWNGYYMDVPLFAESMDTLASWSVGKGLKADTKTLKILEKIHGFGKDTFNTIIENLTKVFLTAGDSFAEIVRDKAGRLTNLKPLNPSRIKTEFNEHGIIERYKQINPTTKTTIGTPFKAKEIFHLPWNRMADESHGKPYAERAEPIIKQIKQLQEDLGIRFHRIVKPLRLYEAKTDDETELAALEVKLANAYKKCDILVTPKGSIEAKDTQVVQNAQDAIQYANDLIRAFVTSCGVPEVILGWSVGTTEASAKIVYLAYQQRIERIQKFLEEQIKIQLGIEVNFEFPASLEPAMTESPNSGKVTNPNSFKKDGNNKAAQKGDLKA
jgi:hypothetical protein